MFSNNLDTCSSRGLTTLRRLILRQDGTALIETALILPVMILMLLGVADFAVVLNQDLRLADSARVAAELATYRADATNTGLMQLVGSYSAAGIPAYTITATNYCTCANGVTTVSCANHANCGTYGIPNQYVRVTTTASLPLIFGIKGLPASLSVQSVAIARTAWTGTN